MHEKDINDLLQNIKFAIANFNYNEMDKTQAFYLTLPSNSSMQIYPSNTVTNFITQLPNSFFLDGDWEVGLSDIQYPYTWNNNIRSGKSKTYTKAWT